MTSVRKAEHEANSTRCRCLSSEATIGQLMIGTPSQLTQTLEWRRPEGRSCFVSPRSSSLTPGGTKVPANAEVINRLIAAGVISECEHYHVNGRNSPLPTNMIPIGRHG